MVASPPPGGGTVTLKEYSPYFNAVLNESAELESWEMDAGCPSTSTIVSTVKLSPTSVTRKGPFPLHRFESTSRRMGAAASETTSETSLERVPSGFLTDTGTSPEALVPAVPPGTWATRIVAEWLTRSSSTSPKTTRLWGVKPFPYT